MKIKSMSSAMVMSIVVATTQVSAQTNEEKGRFVLAGYGDFKYETAELSGTDAFTTRFVPIFLFSLNEKMHVEAELEVSINSEGGTETELEYADIHYFLNDNTILTAGKFLLPFGQFSANWHPSWINRGIWTPGIYGAHGSNQAMEALLPILSDVGMAAQQVYSIGDTKIFIDVFLTNGPKMESEEGGVDDDEHLEIVNRLASATRRLTQDVDEEEHGGVFPEVEFEATSGDNNANKAFGGRIAVALLPTLEVGTSYYKGAYDNSGELDFVANGVDFNIINSHFLLRGEYIKTKTDALEEEQSNRQIIEFERNGWFVQGTLFIGHAFPILGSSELVIERSETNKFAEATRWMFGVNYWLDPRSVIKVGYEDTDLRDSESEKRIAIQYSYGF